MPQNRTISQWLDSITNPSESDQNSRSKSEFKKSVYRSLKRKSTGKFRSDRMSWEEMKPFLKGFKPQKFIEL